MRKPKNYLIGNWNSALVLRYVVITCEKSQVSVADMLGIPHLTTVQRIMDGRESLTLHQISSLADTLKIPPGVLLLKAICADLKNQRLFPEIREMLEAVYPEHFPKRKARKPRRAPKPKKGGAW